MRLLTFPSDLWLVWLLALAAVALAVWWPAPAWAQPDAPEGSDAPEGADVAAGSDVAEGSDDPYASEVRGRGARDPGRSSSRVTRQDIEERQPRSAPDALRYEPGVFVQQTSQAQGSAFLRGRTGQQTVLLFDDVRLNNSTFRQGPNQYFFTIDSRTIQSIEVVRGSASTRWGSDAIGGVLHAQPLEPWLDPTQTGWRATPRAMFRYGSADGELGGRGQVEVQAGRRVGLLLGSGYRDVGLMRSGGQVYGPGSDRLPEVPRFASDGRTQLGTGFAEWTGDARLRVRVTPTLQATLAWYDYRQFDAPRTDQCPAPFAPFDECTRFDEQFRTLVYGALDGNLGRYLLDTKLVLSFQQQHERRTRVRPSAFAEDGGRDDVNTFGVLWRAATPRGQWGTFVQPRLTWGVDAYHDRISSAAWLVLQRLDIVRARSRGQYIEGSHYTTGGAWASGELQLGRLGVVRGGVRQALAAAVAPQDAESGTAAIDQTWTATVGHVGLEWWALPTVSVLAGADQGFRAPNLDDLTSRQQTGPGYQFENPSLDPETAWTYDVGAKVQHPRAHLELWGFFSTVADAIARSSRNTGECPPDTQACNASWSRFQLINLDGVARVYGVEASARVPVAWGLEARATTTWTVGTGPNPDRPPLDPSVPFETRTPLSRIPPLNGTAELVWRGPQQLWAAAAVRWATLQDQLAVSDVADERIPDGGTPGFAVVDLRAGWRWNPWAAVGLVVENLTDTAYRYHGSSVNGPGRGVLVNVEVGR